MAKSLLTNTMSISREMEGGGRANIVNKRSEGGYDIYQCIDEDGRPAEMKIDKKNKKLYITGKDTQGNMQTGIMELY